MPCSHLYLLGHINFCRLLLVCRVSWILRYYFLTLICFVCSRILTTFVHELYINAAVSLVLDVDHVHIGIVPAGHNHARVRGDLQVKLIEDVLGLINLAQLLLQVLRHVEELAGLALVPDVPDLDAEVVTRIDVVVVSGRELRPRN